MAFGTGTAGVLSRNTNNTVQVTDKLDEVGTIVDMTTHGGAEEVTEEIYLAGTFTNEALNGQTGTSVISGHNLVESNVDYARVNKTTKNALASPTTTTTAP